MVENTGADIAGRRLYAYPPECCSDAYLKPLSVSRLVPRSVSGTSIGLVFHSLFGALKEMSLFEIGRNLAAWGKARAIPGRDPSLWRIDCDGRIIYWPDYGDRRSDYGWEIDHILPNALFAWDAIQNLRARHWRGNASAGGILGSILSDV